MSFRSFELWVRGKFTNGSRNEVVPIQINVMPKQANQDYCDQIRVANSVSDSSEENNLQLIRSWDSHIPSVAAASRIIGNLGPFDEENREEIEMLPVVSRTVVPEIQNTLPETDTSINRVSPQLGQELSKIPPLAQTRLRCSGSVIAQMVFIKSALRRKRCECKPSSYMHTYITLMYIFGTSAFQTRKPTALTGGKKWLYLLWTKLQLVVFSVVVTLSAFQPFCHAKYSILWFLFRGGFNRFVRFSYNVTCLVTSVIGAFTLCHKWKSVEKMIRVISSFETTWAKSSKMATICMPLAIVTVIFALLKSILILDDFSVEEALLESSSQMGEDLFIWSSTNLNETIDEIDDYYGTDMNDMTLILAMVKVIRDFSFNMQHGMLWDLIGSVVVTLYCWMSFFMSFVSEVVENVLDDNFEVKDTLQRKREIMWKMYRQIRHVFEAVNDVFGPLLLLFHVTNVFRYAFFMEHCIYPKDFSSFTYFNLLLNILKSEIIYIVASNIAKKNMVLRKCLRNWGSRTGKIDVGYTEIDLTAVLDELDTEPLGLGQGNFVIHQSFHFGLLGLVSSLFVMLASKKP